MTIFQYKTNFVLYLIMKYEYLIINYLTIFVLQIKQ